MPYIQARKTWLKSSAVESAQPTVSSSAGHRRDANRRRKRMKDFLGFRVVLHNQELTLNQSLVAMRLLQQEKQMTNVPPP